MNLMDLWYIKRPKRFMDEYELINKFVSEEEIIINSEWKLKNGILSFFCALQIGDEQFPIKMQYPFFSHFTPISITELFLMESKTVDRSSVLKRYPLS